MSITTTPAFEVGQRVRVTNVDSAGPESAWGKSIEVGDLGTIRLLASESQFWVDIDDKPAPFSGAPLLDMLAETLGVRTSWPFNADKLEAVL